MLHDLQAWPQGLVPDPPAPLPWCVNLKLGPLASSWLPGLVWPEMGPMVNGTCQRIGLKEEDGDTHWTHEVSSCSC